MKYPGYQAGQDPIIKQRERMQVTDIIRLRGTPVPPSAPRDVFVQPAPRGLYVTWKLPENGGADIAGWRIYKDTENTLFDAIKDRGNRQKVIDVTSGSTPPVVNVFVSAVNAFGTESAKVQAQGSATVEAAAPTFPAVPPGYNQESSGGADTSDQLGSRSLNTNKQGANSA